MNTPVHEVSLSVSLPVILSIQLFSPVSLCCDLPMRWSVLSIYPDMYAIHPMNMLLHEWSPSRLLYPERGWNIFLPSSTSLSVQVLKRSFGWASVCQLWFVSIITLPLLQSHLSSFVRSITFAWSAAFMHQREAVISASKDTVEGHDS